MTSLSDAERDVCDVLQALAGIAAALSHRPAGELSEVGRIDLADDDARRLLIGIAEDGSVAADRVLAYLRELRGAGDGELVAVPRRLGPWREWVPQRGHVFGAPGFRRVNGVPQPRRCDPGE